MLDCLQQRGVLLTHNLVELCRPHARSLQLLEGLSGIDALMLACVANHKHLILWSNLIQEIAHLLRRCQRGFIDHIKMLACGIAGGLQAAARNEALQSIRLNTSITELLRRPRSRCKTFHGVAVPFGSLAYSRQNGSFATTSPSL